MSLNSRIACIARRNASGAAMAGLVVGLLALGGCSQMPKFDALSVSGDKVLGLVTPYRVEIVQGNVVTKEQLAAIKPGMTRVQVRDVLGSPLLTDVFHESRWDYVFTIRRQGAQPQQRSVTIFFEADRVSKFEATDLPSEREFVASISTAKVSSKVPNLQLSEKDVNALPLPEKPAPSAAEPAASGPVRTYPPLEPAAQ